jgi:hypothetical protein
MILRDVEVSASDDQVTVYLRSDGPLQYKTMVLKAPDRLVVDLSNTVVGTKPSPGSVDVASLGVTRVRWALFQSEPPIARIVVDMEGSPRQTVEETADGLVIRIAGKN